MEDLPWNRQWPIPQSERKKHTSSYKHIYERLPVLNCTVFFVSSCFITTFISQRHILFSALKNMLPFSLCFTICTQYTFHWEQTDVSFDLWPNVIKTDFYTQPVFSGPDAVHGRAGISLPQMFWTLHGNSLLLFFTAVGPDTPSHCRWDRNKTRQLSQKYKMLTNKLYMWHLSKHNSIGLKAVK